MKKIIKLKKGQKVDGYLIIRGHCMMTKKAYYPALKGKPTNFTEPTLVFVGWEDKNNYYGNLPVGFGFFGLRFPKKYTRELIAQEIKKYKKYAIQHSSGLIVKDFIS